MLTRLENDLNAGSGIAKLLTFSGWDLALIVLVSLQATLLAYLPQPRWKAFLFTLPIPFTLATLSLGQPVNCTNVAGLLLLFGYAGGVYVLHARWQFPIVPAIIACAIGYCGLAALLAPHLPQSDLAFWGVVTFVFLTGVLLYSIMPARDEPSYRSPLPVHLKLPLIMMVIFFLVLVKRYLQGFMTMFPMVGVIGSYEGRHCLWTLTRQVPVLMMTTLPMMVTMRLLYPFAGLAGSLAGGWVVFLAILIPLTRRQWAAVPKE